MLRALPIRLHFTSNAVCPHMPTLLMLANRLKYRCLALRLKVHVLC